MPDVASNVRSVQARVERASRRSGRNPADITLVAVSKTFPTARVVDAFDAGIRHFGENRVEEANVKIKETAEFVTPVTWHMIGTLQHRKVKDAVDLFDIIESVDSVQLAQRLENRLAISGKQMPILLEINVGGETSKHGFRFKPLEDIIQAIQQLTVFSHLELRGLMTIAPIVSEPEQARPYFRAMRETLSALQSRFPSHRLNDLSMGMSDDFEVAIEEGATIIRVGRAIFGDRN